MRSAAPLDPAQARDAAKAILQQKRFKPLRAPGLPQGPFRAIGRALLPALRWIGRALRALARALRGGEPVGWIVLLVVVVLVASAVRTIARRRVRVARTPAARGHSEAVDPDALEQEADDAERRGLHDDAVRLRFLAGLRRLELIGAIAPTRRRTNRQVLAALPAGPAAEGFARLAAGFESIVHGHQHAGPEDAAVARAGWQQVLDASAREVAAARAADHSTRRQRGAPAAA